jgi:BMFP domain-containing protein YqiC
MAVDNKTLDDISEKIAAGIKMLGGIKMGAEAQIQHIVEDALAHFDVVTHERMQVQEAMLKKAREDLQKMEERIAKLEAQLKG